MRDFIIEIATDLFGRHGNQGMTVRPLTLAAKVNLGAITSHFGGKEELYRMAVEALKGVHRRVDRGTRAGFAVCGGRGGR